MTRGSSTPVKRSKARQALPRNVLRNVYWQFESKPTADRARFIARVTREQADSSHPEAWRPDEIVLARGRIKVLYYGIAKPKDVEYTRYVIGLAADNRQSFTAGELLFKLHNAVQPRLRNADHRYFEGLTRKAAGAARGVPTYEMKQGS